MFLKRIKCLITLCLSVSFGFSSFSFKWQEQQLVLSGGKPYKLFLQSHAVGTDALQNADAESTSKSLGVRKTNCINHQMTADRREPEPGRIQRLYQTWTRSHSTYSPFLLFAFLFVHGSCSGSAGVDELSILVFSKRHHKRLKESLCPAAPTKATERCYATPRWCRCCLCLQLGAEKQ